MPRNIKETKTNFTVYKAKWPKDSSDLSGKTLEIYLMEGAYFPYWIEVKGATVRGRLRILEVGEGLFSHKQLPPKLIAFCSSSYTSILPMDPSLFKNKIEKKNNDGYRPNDRFRSGKPNGMGLIRPSHFRWRKEVHLSGVIEGSLCSGDGEVHILGDHIVLQGAKIDVSSDFRAGGVWIGTKESREVTIDPDSIIYAHAKVRGDGGEVWIFSREKTSFLGRATIHGGDEGGDGGVIDTSSLGLLQRRSGDQVVGISPNGKNGMWILDPPTVGLNIDQSYADTNLNNALSNQAIQADFIMIEEGVEIKMPHALDLSFTTTSGDIIHRGSIEMDGGAKLLMDSNDAVQFLTSSSPFAVKLKTDATFTVDSMSLQIDPKRTICSSGPSASSIIFSVNNDATIKGDIRIPYGSMTLVSGGNLTVTGFMEGTNGGFVCGGGQNRLSFTGGAKFDNALFFGDDQSGQILVEGGVSGKEITFFGQKFATIRGTVDASGDMIFQTPTFLDDVSLSALNIDCQKTVDGKGDISMQAVHMVRFHEGVGQSSPPSSLRVDAPKIFVGANMSGKGNTMVFSGDFILTADVTVTDPGGLFFEENIFSSPAGFKLTLDTQGDILVHGKTSLGLSSLVSEVKIKNGNNVIFEGPILTGLFIQEKGRGDTIIFSKLSTEIPFLPGGDISITTNGSIFCFGDLITRGDPTFSPGFSGGSVTLHSLKGSILVGGITTDGGLGLLLGGDAGNITLLDNTGVEISDQLTFRPLGRVGIFGELSAKGGAGETPGMDGVITLSGDRAEIPDIATVYGNPLGGNINITGGDITFGQNSVVTSFGELNLVSSGTLTIGDMIAVGDINLTAQAFTLLGHEVGKILVANGSVISSLILHATSGGEINTFIPVGGVSLGG